jgi:hypothetical protein
MAGGQSFERVINLMRADLTSPEFQKWHAEVARLTLAEELASRDDDPEVTTIVDGRIGASEDSVKLHGVIVYELVRNSRAIGDLLKWLQAEAGKLSPKYARSLFVGVLKETAHTRAKGRGKKHWTTFGAEGRMIPASKFSAASRGLPPDASFIIGASVPWNRKADVQMIGRERMKFSVDDMIWDRAALWINAHFPEYSARRVWNLQFDADPATGAARWTLRTGPKRGSKVESPGLVVRRV